MHNCSPQLCSQLCSELSISLSNTYFCSWQMSNTSNSVRKRKKWLKLLQEEPRSCRLPRSDFELSVHSIKGCPALHKPGCGVTQLKPQQLWRRKQEYYGIEDHPPSILNLKPAGLHETQFQKSIILYELLES